jgi:gliding motility-associated-like protein
MKRFLLLLVILMIALQDKAQAQAIVIVEGDTLYLCQPGPVTLHAVSSGIDTSQLVSSVALNSVDDTYSGVINIGFPFVFYGTPYNQCLLSTNGYITFDLAGAGGFSPWTIAAANSIPTAAFPTNSIMGPWQDTYPGAPGASSPGYVSYATTGTAPFRKFIFNFCDVPMYSCVQQKFSGQIILYETTNEFEFHIKEKVICSNWNGGRAILGCQNANGTLATAIYNSPTQWSATNQAWRMTPNGNNNYTYTTIPYNPVPVYVPNQLQWTWNGSPAGNGDSVIINVTQSGIAVVSFAGCFGTSSISAGSDTIHIIVDQLVTNQSRKVSACYNLFENELYAAFPQNTEPLQITWLDSLGNVLEVHSNVISFDTLKNVAEGGYQLHIVKPSGCEYDYLYKMPKRLINPSFTVAPNLICQYAPVTFTNNSTGIINNYAWGFGDNSSATTYNATHSYSDFGDYAVVLTVWNDTFQCMFSDTVNIYVNKNIVADINSFSFFCETDPIYFSDQSNPYPVSWQWINNNTVFATTKDAEITFYQPGSYDITLIVTDSLCGKDTITKSYFVNAYPIVNIAGDTFFCPGELVTLDAGNPGYEFMWSTGATTQTISMEVYETQQFSVEVNNQGCKTSDAITVYVNCNFYFPNAFSPNGDGYNDRFRPHLVNMESYEVYIYNRWGEMVYSFRGYGNSSDEVGWDGTYRGEKAPLGTYVYTAVGKTIKGQPVEKKGNFALLR